MFGPYVHRIDPVLTQIGPLCLWWYGLSYTLGFLTMHRWFGRTRRELGMSAGDVYRLSILIAAGVLLGGRLVATLFYEWEYYGSHLYHIPAYWIGGMSTHGILLGAIVSTWVFCKWRGKSFLQVCDMLVVPGAFIMGVGRIGNFIDGQIVGSLTDMPWGVQFPDAEGFRHPVVLYDGIKNLMLIPLLLLVRRSKPKTGVTTAHFLFWYGFLRIFVDLFRDYRVEVLGLGPGQYFNILMAVMGAALFVWCSLRGTTPQVGSDGCPDTEPGKESDKRSLWPARVVFALLLLFSLTLPSDRTQDVPARYGDRHPGLRHSTLYPPVEWPTSDASEDNAFGDSARIPHGVTDVRALARIALDCRSTATPPPLPSTGRGAREASCN